MSRAFVKEADDDLPPRRYSLPPRDDPDFDAAAARALLEGARIGDTGGAEEATGLVWGDPKLRGHVTRLLAEAETAGDDRLAQVAERFLARANRT